MKKGISLVILFSLVLIAVPLKAQTKSKSKAPTGIVEQKIRPANGSLFTDDARNVDIVNDFRPRRIGDIVFIDIQETSTASVSSNASSSKNASALGGAVLGAAPIPPEFFGAAAGLVAALSKRSFDGKGATSRKSELKARIATRVTEILPNGDLHIEAIKQTKINKETEKLTLRGTIRLRDVGLDNAVPSSSVADLKLELNGKGIASSGNADGWLLRIFQRISPF